MCITREHAIDMTSRGIVYAVCTCPAGASESCVHVSALLHALECLYESPKNALLAGSAVGEPKTSMQCTWLKPRKRKVAATNAHDMTYVKHEYGKKRKRKSWTADFDPRPPQARAVVHWPLLILLGKFYLVDSEIRDLCRTSPSIGHEQSHL